MFSQNFFNKRQFISTALAVAASVAAVAGLVYAATTIGTNVSVDGNLVISGTSATSTFSTGGLTVGTSQFVVQQTSGNVGIGTTSPAALFAVAGNSFFGTGSVSSLTYNAGIFMYAQSATSTIPQSINAWSLATSTVAGNPPIFSVDGLNGRVGIGTAAPSVKVSVITSTNDDGFLLQGASTTGVTPTFKFNNSNGTTYARIGIAGAAGGLVPASAPNDLVIRSAQKMLFSTNDGFDDPPSLTILSNGRVGIGTSTPYSRFHVSQGASATTTVNFGEVGSATSKACFNTKNVSGADISFYFSAANTMVVESNLCR